MRFDLPVDVVGRPGREVAGDGAMLIDPYDTRAIAEGIRELDTNAELRGSLSARGRRRANRFSPQAYQRRVSALYDRVLQPRRASMRRSGRGATLSNPNPRSTARERGTPVDLAASPEATTQLAPSEVGSSG